jgi:hypothetical protein
VDAVPQETNIPEGPGITLAVSVFDADKRLVTDAAILVVEGGTTYRAESSGGTFLLRDVAPNSLVKILVHTEALGEAIVQLPVPPSAQGPVQINVNYTGPGEAFVIRPAGAGDTLPPGTPIGGPCPCTQPAANCLAYSTDNATQSNATFLSAESFVPDVDGTITDICWWGAYIPSPPAGADSYTVTIYSDVGGFPGATIGGPFIQGFSLTVTAPCDTGDLVAGIAPIFEYTGALGLGGAAVTAGTTYWLEIANIPTGGETWFWEWSHEADDSSLTTSVPDPYGPEDLQPHDFAFCIDLPLAGEPPPPPCEPAPGGPVNDCCVDKLPISNGATPYSTVGAGTDGPAHGSCMFDGQTYHDIWYNYTATFNGDLTVSTCGTAAYDTDLVVYDGCDCDNLNLLACNDDAPGCSGFTSEVIVPVVSGNCYKIRVGGWNDGDQGTGTLTITKDLPVGGCCLPDASCIDGVTQQECEEAGGEWFEGEECSEHVFEITDCANDFQDISGTGTALSLSDDGGSVVPIGFTFGFFKNLHDEVAVCSNGYLTFGGDLTDFTNDPIPSTTDPNDAIFPFWDDLDPGNTGSPATVHYETKATPNRFIAQWTDVPEFPNTGANTFQAVLFEGSDCIEFRYGSMTADSSGTDVTIGVENQDGTDGYAVAGPVVPGQCVSLCPFEILLIECGCPPCGHNNNKVLICHIPPGNPGNAHDICIAEAAVPAHEAEHGDGCGPCARAKSELGELPSMQVDVLSSLFGVYIDARGHGVLGLVRRHEA